MKIVKKQIVTFLVVMISVIMMHRYCFAQSDETETKIKAQSATQFWAHVTNRNDKLEDTKEYIICGQNICDAEIEKCAVKMVERHDLYHLAMKQCSEGVSCSGLILGKFINWTRGSKTVTTYEYMCYAKEASPPAGYKEAPEGGYVQRRKVVTGGKWVDSKVKEESCTKGNDGKQYCLMTKEKGDSVKKASVVYNASDTAFRGCEVIPVKLYNNRKCFYCKLISIMYAASNHITSISFETFAIPFAVVMAMGLAIWIAVKVLGFVSSISKQDAPKFLTELIKQSYKVLIAFVLLLSSEQLFNGVIINVLEAGLKFSEKIISESGRQVNSSNLLIDSLDKLEDPDKIERVKASHLSKTKGTKYYSQELYLKIDNFIEFVQREISFMQSVGSSLLCVGGNALIWRGSIITWGDGFQLVVMGILLAGFAFLLTIAFSFYLVDAIVQLGIVGALLPFMIATWPFKITSKHSKVGWNMILNSTFMFLFSGMVVVVDLSLVDSALTYTANNGKNKVISETEEEIKTGGLYEIAAAIHSQNEGKVVELTDISSVGFLILLFCCIYGFQFMGKASELAGKFAGGALKPIAPGIATMAGSAAKSLALKSTQHTREAIAGKAKNTRKAIWGGVKSIFKGGGGSAAGADETAAAMSSNREDASKGASSRTRSTIANANAKLKNSPVISEGTAKGKPVISEDSNHGEKDVSKSRAEENFSEGNNEDNKKENTQKSSQTNADMSNAKGSSRYVDLAKNKYDRFNKPKKNPKSSKNKRKPIKTNKRRK